MYFGCFLTITTKISYVDNIIHYASYHKLESYLTIWANTLHINHHVCVLATSSVLVAVKFFVSTGIVLLAVNEKLVKISSKGVHQLLFVSQCKSHRLLVAKTEFHFTLINSKVKACPQSFVLKYEVQRTFLVATELEESTLMQAAISYLNKADCFG